MQAILQPILGTYQQAQTLETDTAGAAAELSQELDAEQMADLQTAMDLQNAGNEALASQQTTADLQKLIQQSQTPGGAAATQQLAGAVAGAMKSLAGVVGGLASLGLAENTLVNKLHPAPNNGDKDEHPKGQLTLNIKYPTEDTGTDTDKPDETSPEALAKKKAQEIAAVSRSTETS